MVSIGIFERTNPLNHGCRFQSEFDIRDEQREIALRRLSSPMKDMRRDCGDMVPDR